MTKIVKGEAKNQIVSVKERFREEIREAIEDARDESVTRILLGQWHEERALLRLRLEGELPAALFRLAKLRHEYPLNVEQRQKMAIFWNKGDIVGDEVEKAF